MSEEDQNPFDGDDVIEEEEQFCWRDSSRLCGKECVAYDEKCEGDSRWLPCILLNIQRAQAKSFANIATELKRYNDRKDTSDEEMRDVLVGVNEMRRKREEADAYAEKLKEMDQPPPEIKT